MIKLYDKDSYIFRFDGKVISCEEENGEYKTVLDQTAFFPTAGGQECLGHITMFIKMPITVKYGFI